MTTVTCAKAITDLAVEREGRAFGLQEFRTLNRCLDNAIARRDHRVQFQRDAARDAVANQRVGFLATN
jgi:hypothetical protein